MNIHEIRELGKNFCQTVGSQHYVKIRENGGIDAIEIAMANGIFEDFAITNMVKYALRFKHTRNLDDLKKVSDYSHILCGVELSKENKPKMQDGEIEKYCNNCKYACWPITKKPCIDCEKRSKWEPMLEVTD